TVMNTATNPRTGGAAAADAGGRDPAPGPAASGTAGSGGGDDSGPGGEESDPGAAGLDLRSRPQKLLDGLVGACKVALASGSLPAAGGLRPQVMVTIDYRDLLASLRDTGAGGAAGDGTHAATGTLLFTGPVTAATVRKIA